MVDKNFEALDNFHGHTQTQYYPRNDLRLRGSKPALAVANHTGGLVGTDILVQSV